MTYKENIAAILECYFGGFKKEIIDSACDRILEQRPSDYKRAFKIACELLNGAILYGVDTDSIFETLMNEGGIVTNESYEKYILSHMDELDHGQYASQTERGIRNV